MAEKKTTASQLRRDIDRGETRDKVPVEDPAAAPLGTDDEAAGTPISDEQAAAARREEVDARNAHPDTGTGRVDADADPAARPVHTEVPRDERPTSERQKETLPMRQVVLLVALVAIGVVVVALIFA